MPSIIHQSFQGLQGVGKGAGPIYIRFSSFCAGSIKRRTALKRGTTGGERALNFVELDFQRGERLASKCDSKGVGSKSIWICCCLRMARLSFFLPF